MNARETWRRIKRNVKIDPVTECWNWQGYTDQEGYAQMGKPKKRITRLIVMLRSKRLDPDKLVLHSCDNPSCVNPKHLRIGTHKDNVDDQRQRGRLLQGETKVNHVLTEEDVRKIRAARGVPLRELKQQFKVSFSTLSRVRNGKRWRHIP